MKQLFIGIIIGLGIAGGIVFFMSSSSLESNDIQSNIDIVEGELNTIISSDEGNSQQSNIVGTEFIKANLDTLLSSSEQMNKFIVESGYPFSAALYAIKNKNLDLWQSYWLSLFDSLEQKPFEREIFKDKISLAYSSILEDSLDMKEYEEYLLDGAVYFSSEDLINKQSTCKSVFNDLNTEFPSDGEKYCNSLSYVYEAIRTNDVSFCMQISFIPEDTNLVENCEALFSDI